MGGYVWPSGGRRSRRCGELIFTGSGAAARTGSTSRGYVAVCAHELRPTPGLAAVAGRHPASGAQRRRDCRGVDRAALGHSPGPVAPVAPPPSPRRRHRDRGDLWLRRGKCGLARGVASVGAHPERQPIQRPKRRRSRPEPYSAGQGAGGAAAGRGDRSVRPGGAPAGTARGPAARAAATAGVCAARARHAAGRGGAGGGRRPQPDRGAGGRVLHRQDQGLLGGAADCCGTSRSRGGCGIRSTRPAPTPRCASCPASARGPWCG